MSGKKKISPFLLLRLLGIILFIIVLLNVDLQQVIIVLSQVKPGYLFLGILFQLLLLAFKGIRWHLMNDGRRERKYWQRSLAVFFESYAIGVVTPGRLGELLKAGHEKTRDDKTGALVRVFSERGFDVGLFILAAILALYSGEYLSLPLWLLILLLSGSFALLVLAWMVLSSQKTLKFIERLLQHLPGKFRTTRLTVMHYPTSRVALVAVLSLFSNLSYFLSCFFLALATGLNIPFLEVSGGVAIAGLLNMLPVTIMGLGTREVTFLTLFPDYNQSAILAFSFLILIVAQWGGGLVSFIAAYLFSRKAQKPENE